MKLGSERSRTESEDTEADPGILQSFLQEKVEFIRLEGLVVHGAGWDPKRGSLVWNPKEECRQGALGSIIGRPGDNRCKFHFRVLENLTFFFNKCKH